jgi:hypothetical protein
VADMRKGGEEAKMRKKDGRGERESADGVEEVLRGEVGFEGRDAIREAVLKGKRAS